MKIFTQEVNNCFKCNFFDKEFTECHYTKEIFQEYLYIHETCPFNKPLTKKDIESFGFKYIENKNIYILKTKLFVIKIFPKIGKNRFVIEQYIKNSKIPLSKGLFIITSKPHLKFILQILNIVI